MVISPSLCAGMLQSACSAHVPNISSTWLSPGHQGTEAEKLQQVLSITLKMSLGPPPTARHSFKNSPRLFFCCLPCLLLALLLV